MADIFNEEESQRVEIPAFDSILDHGRFQVAHRAGKNLLYWRLTASQARGVIFRGQIADKSCNPPVGTQKSQSLLEESCFAGAGAGDEADCQNARRAETLA
jgi:hypothetical protein